MRMAFNRLSLGCILRLGCGVAVAGEYYVSPDGRPGNAGTKEAPFATIQQAADVAQAGNVVIQWPVKSTAVAGNRRMKERNDDRTT